MLMMTASLFSSILAPVPPAAKADWLPPSRSPLNGAESFGRAGSTLLATGSLPGIAAFWKGQDLSRDDTVDQTARNLHDRLVMGPGQAMT